MKKTEDKYRLKIYIPNSKWNLWTNHMEKTDPYSTFFQNFSQWVRECLRKIPLPYLLIFSPNLKEVPDRENDFKLEKTIWISKITHKALEVSRDLLSLNQYVIYILEYHIFGEINPKSTYIQVSQLEQRLHQLEEKLNYLFEKESILYKRK